MLKSRRIISVLLSALLIVTSIAGLSFTAGAKSGDTIYFEKPDTWGSNVYVYFWDASQNPEWPGNEMTHVSGSLYSYTCTGTFTKLLFDDNGSYQTGDLNFPGDGYVCNVKDTFTTNQYGNKCWDAEWTKYNPGLTASASPESCDFMDSVTVTLNCTNATSAYYTVNGGEQVAYTDGTVITLGADAKVGDTITLEVTASDDKDTVSNSYVYTKTSSPVGASIVYFDNSSYNWDEVYLYAYGSKENAEWPGVKMQKDSNGLYYYTFTSGYADENILVNNGKEGDESQQYPANGGLNIKTGQCKLLTSENQWVDYGTPDGKPAGFVYTPSGTAFNTEKLNVKIGLKNAVSGTYQLDGGTVFPYTEETVIAVGEGKIGNSDTTLTLTATSDSGVTTSYNYTFTKTFTKSITTFSAKSDGHTSDAIGGNYGTNPDMQLGSYKTISVDGDVSDWDSSMIIAQGVANDDPRVYMPSAMHEQPWDDYALYAAWDDNNLYFMWEMANTTYITSPSDDFAASKEARPWRNSIPMYLALSINPEISADGTAYGTDKTGAPFTNPFVWGCDGGVAKDGGINFTTHVDTLVAFDSNNSNGGASIFKADVLDESTGNYMFNYDSAVPIGVTSFEKQDNRNGFKIAHEYNTLSKSLIGVNGQKGTRTLGDSFLSTSNWVDFFDLGYKNDYGFVYEVGIPFKTLGIDKEYIEKNGIGAMQILTYGTSGMDCLPYDATMQDSANVEYSYDPSTSHEKEDVDNITVPLARVGALLSDTVIKEAPLEVNFGTDKSGTQGVNSNITLKAETYNGSGNYTYNFTVDGVSLKNGSDTSCAWTPNEKKTYKISVTVTDTDTGKTVTSEKSFTVGDTPVIVDTTPTNPTTNPSTNPTTNSTGNSTVTNPTQGTSGNNPTQGTSATSSTDPSESSVPTASTGNSTGTNPTKPNTNPTPTPAPTPTATDPTESTAASSSDTKVPSLEKSSVSAKAGSTYKIVVKNAGGKKISYKSNNEKILKVSSKGKVTFLKKGNSTVTVKVGSKKLTFKGKVMSDPKLTYKDKTVKASKTYKVSKGKTITIKIKGKADALKNKYTSTKIAKIKGKTTASKFNIKGLKKGTTTLKITVNRSKTLKIKVKVK